MTKYLSLLIFLLGLASTSQAQFISVDKSSMTDAPQKPTVQTTRAAFLSMNVALQAAIDKFIFTDLVQQASSSGLEDGKFYLTEAQFYAFSAERKLHIIQNPTQYIVVNTLAARKATPIQEAEFNTFSAEKQALIRNNPDYIIVK